MSGSPFAAPAARFAERWKDATSERSEKQTFWNEFFNVFDVDRLTVAAYEDSASMIGQGAIDLFWPGKLIVEHKSAGKPLDEAFLQAAGYIGKIKQKKYKPRYVVTCDFTNFRLFDLDEGNNYEFTLAELPDRIELFNFMVDKPLTETDTDPVNQKAANIMGQIYDGLKRINYPPQDTEKILTRLAFCMFADDTGIFEHGTLRRWLVKHDVVSTGGAINIMFEILNTPEEERQTTIPDELKAFTYINGDLFTERIAPANLDMELRNRILEANEYDWSKINPAVFGGMFQSVMDKDERRELGAHYTTEENILKVIKPLLLDELWNRFARLESRRDRTELEKFQEHLASFNLLDPACGSGNFLSVAYKELRRLELRVIELLHPKEIKRLDVSILSKIDVNRFYGIEILPFSASIAEISLWMIDHLMNRELGARYGITYDRIPLAHSPNIVCADALDMDWNELLPATHCSYILGNPPYHGHRHMTPNQRDQISRVFGKKVDYVAGWIQKAKEYIADTDIVVGFVTSNSITQGEHVPILWPRILRDVEIVFAHRSFVWDSEGRGKAHVHVVVLGFANTGMVKKKRLFDEGGNESNPETISPHLSGAGIDVTIHKATAQLSKLPTMKKGLQKYDGNRTSHYTFTEAEKNEFLVKCPNARPFFRPLLDARTFLNGGVNYVLYLHDIDPGTLRNMPDVLDRVNKVKEYRQSSNSLATRRAANTPTEFMASVIPTKRYLVIPVVSSGKRRYVPMAFVNPPSLTTNANAIIEGCGVELFALLTSRMHMVWVYHVGGRLKGDYRYSVNLVYNTFPAPSNYSSLKRYGQAVLDARAEYPNSTLADLYDPLAMPSKLVTAHGNLDRQVEKLYRKQPFDSDRERFKFLAGKYKELVEKKLASEQ